MFRRVSKPVLFVGGAVVVSITQQIASCPSSGNKGFQQRPRNNSASIFQSQQPNKKKNAVLAKVQHPFCGK